MAYPRTAKFVALVVALLAAFTDTELLTFGAVRFFAPHMFSEEDAYFGSIDADQT